MASEIILFTKEDRFSRDAQDIARSVLPNRVRCVSGGRGDPFPDLGEIGAAPILLSFLSPWIISRDLLRQASLAINFHPGSRAYPGIGCYNFALYERAGEYGAVCHFMAERVDRGALIEERRFPLFEADTVESLKLRTMITLLSMFHDAVSRIAAGEELKPMAETWERAPFTRRELDALGRIEPGMAQDEVRRRVRAMTYPGYPGAFVEIGGEQFLYPVPNRKPLA